MAGRPSRRRRPACRVCGPAPGRAGARGAARVRRRPARTARRAPRPTREWCSRPRCARRRAPDAGHRSACRQQVVAAAVVEVQVCVDDDVDAVEVEVLLAQWIEAGIEIGRRRVQLGHAGVDQHAGVGMVDHVHVDRHPLTLGQQVGDEQRRDRDGGGVHRVPATTVFTTRQYRVARASPPHPRTKAWVAAALAHRHPLAACEDRRTRAVGSKDHVSARRSPRSVYEPRGPGCTLEKKRERPPEEAWSRMGATGLEPVTPSLSSWCSPN